MDTLAKDPVATAIKLLGHKGLARMDGRRSCQRLGFFIQTMSGYDGYRFFVGDFGVYSETFIEDMHNDLAGALDGDPTPENKGILTRISALVKDSPLNPHELLDVVASYEYARTVMEYDEKEALALIRRESYREELLDKLYPGQDDASVIPNLDNLSRDLKELIGSNI